MEHCAAVRIVRFDGLHYEAAQEPQHGRGESATRRRLDLFDLPSHLGAALDSRLVDTDETQCRKAQGHRHRVGVDDVELELLGCGRRLWPAGLPPEVAAAGEDGLPLLVRVPADVVTKYLDDNPRYAIAVAQWFQRGSHIVGDGIRAVERQVFDRGRRIEDA